METNKCIGNPGADITPPNIFKGLSWAANLVKAVYAVSSVGGFVLLPWCCTNSRAVCIPWESIGSDREFHIIIEWFWLEGTLKII